MVLNLVLIDFNCKLSERFSKLIKGKRCVSHIASFLKYLNDLLFVESDPKILCEN